MAGDGPGGRMVRAGHLVCLEMSRERIRRQLENACAVLGWTLCVFVLGMSIWLCVAIGLEILDWSAFTWFDAMGRIIGISALGVIIGIAIVESMRNWVR